MNDRSARLICVLRGVFMRDYDDRCDSMAAIDESDNNDDAPNSRILSRAASAARHANCLR